MDTKLDRKTTSYPPSKYGQQKCNNFSLDESSTEHTEHTTIIHVSVILDVHTVHFLKYLQLQYPKLKLHQARCIVEPRNTYNVTLV